VHPLLKLLLLLGLVGLPYAGCTADPEEKAFFYRGWVHPETDADEERHMREAREAAPPPYHDPLDQ
jgi:hypothetical protein